MTNDQRPKSATELAARADAYKTTFVALQLALIPLLHPAGFMERVLDDITPGLSTGPLTIDRADGTTASVETVEYWLKRARDNNGKGLGLHDDLLAFTCMFAVTRLEDDLLKLGLRNKDSSLFEFLRHLRNAAAHGNRWHFTGTEPKNAAKLRSINLDSSMHGATALYAGTVGPGDFLDLLDDVRDELLLLP